MSFRLPFSFLLAVATLTAVEYAFAQLPASPDAEPAKPAAAPPPATPAEINVPTAPNAPGEPADFPPTRRSRRSSRSGRNDLHFIGAPVNVRTGETIREVVAVGSTVRIDGTVENDLVVVLGKTTLGPSARVMGEMVVVGGTFDADPAARLGRNPVVVSPEFLMGSFTNVVPNEVVLATWNWFRAGPLQIRPLPLPHQSFWAWVVAAFCVVLYALIELLFPRSVRATMVALEEKPGTAFLTGLLAAFLLLPLLALLTVTVIGIAVIPFIFCALVGMLILGKTSLYRHAGAAVASHLGLGWLGGPLTTLLMGAAIFFLAYCVPVFGAIIWGLAAPLAFGAVLLTALGRSGKSNPVADAVPLAASEGGSTAGTPVVAGRRVGFWLRLVATALDLALVFLVFIIVARGLEWFLPGWFLYHLAFWIGRGTTLGGIICGLRIVRRDGRPLGAGTAIIRLLGSVFSLAVAGLGFFWAGWSAEKQSWHDKIAGTLVIRA